MILHQAIMLRAAEVITDDLVAVHGLFGDMTSPCECQHVLDNGGGPMPRLSDSPQRPQQRTVIGQPHQQQVGVSNDATQNVVQIVRHATGQGAYGLHFFGPMKTLRQQGSLIFGLFAAVDVA